MSWSVSGVPLTNLSTLCIGGKQIDHFDARDQDLLLDTHVCELRSLSMNRSRSERQGIILQKIKNNVIFATKYS